MNMKYQQWLDCPGMNEELLGQLKAMNEEQISDSFYRELAFGTGGHDTTRLCLTILDKEMPKGISFLYLITAWQ